MSQGGFRICDPGGATGNRARLCANERYTGDFSGPVGRIAPGSRAKPELTGLLPVVDLRLVKKNEKEHAPGSTTSQQDECTHESEATILR